MKLLPISAFSMPSWGERSSIFITRKQYTPRVLAFESEVHGIDIYTRQTLTVHFQRDQPHQILMIHHSGMKLLVGVTLPKHWNFFFPYHGAI